MSFLQVRWVFAGVLLVASVLLGVAPAGAAPVACAERASVLLCDADGDADGNWAASLISGSAVNETIDPEIVGLYALELHRGLKTCTVRDLLSGQSYADQYAFGMDVLAQIRGGSIP